MKGSVDMKRFDLIIVGAGPSGLSAAIEAAKRGLEVVVFDENEKPGGQLFKQIHKFFGSKEHKAKIRGFKIGEDLLKEADAAGVKVVLNATVCGMYQDKEITVRIGDENNNCYRRSRKYGYISRLDIAGGYWCRSSTDNDESSWS